LEGKVKLILVFFGLLFSIFNMLPIPWRLRIAWLKFLYFLTDSGTRIFPAILEWMKVQNTTYKMGKQTGEEYESIVQLEKILEYLEKSGVSPHQVSQAMSLAEKEAVPPSQLGAFLAQETLDPSTATQALRKSLESARY
jgi:hypothetical protein